MHTCAAIIIYFIVFSIVGNGFIMKQTYYSVARMIIILSIIYTLLWDFIKKKKRVFIDTVHKIEGFSSNFSNSIHMCFLDLLMSSHSFINREN